jgi:hypothetical protein
MATLHPTDHTEPKQEAPGPEAAPAPAEPQSRKDGFRRVVVFVGRHRPQQA